MKHRVTKLKKEFRHVFDGITDPGRRYEDLAEYRREYLEFAIFCSAYTMPETIPWYADTDFNNSSSFSNNFITKPCAQSIGAEGVSSLATRFYQNLFPANTSFFKLETDDILLQRSADTSAREQLLAEYYERPENAGNRNLPDNFDPQSLPPDLKQRYKQLYNQVKNTAKASAEKVVKMAMEEYNKLNIDHKMKELFINLIIAGNALLEVTETTCRIYSLDQYVVNRDPRGELTEIIIKEFADVSTLIPHEDHD